MVNWRTENVNSISGILTVLAFLFLSPSVSLAQTVPAYYTVTSTRLNVRKQPSAESTVIGGLSKGDTINVRTMKKSWAEIDFKKGIGYVSKSYIEPIQITSIAEPEPQETITKLSEIIEEQTSPKPEKYRISFFKQWRLRLTSTTSLGLSNLYSFDAYSSPRFGFGLDVGAQLTADFMPKNMFSEVTFGFMSLGNSNYSFPSFSFNFLPVGYRSNPFSFWIFHGTRYYAVGGLSFQFSGGGIFFSRNSQYYSFYSKPTVNFYVKGGLELTNMVAVGFIYMHGFDNVCHNLPIGIKHSVFQIYGSFLFDKWKKK